MNGETFQQQLMQKTHKKSYKHKLNKVWFFLPQDDLVLCIVNATLQARSLPSQFFGRGPHTPKQWQICEDVLKKMYRKSRGVFCCFGGPLSFCSFSQRTKQINNFSKCPKNVSNSYFFSKNKKTKTTHIWNDGVWKPNISSPTDSVWPPKSLDLLTEVNGWEQVFTEQSTTGNSSTGPLNRSG